MRARYFSGFCFWLESGLAHLNPQKRQICGTSCGTVRPGENGGDLSRKKRNSESEDGHEAKGCQPDATLISDNQPRRFHRRSAIDSERCHPVPHRSASTLRWRLGNISRHIITNPRPDAGPVTWSRTSFKHFLRRADIDRSQRF